MNCRQELKVKCQNYALFTQNKSCFDLHEESGNLKFRTCRPDLNQKSLIISKKKYIF